VRAGGTASEWFEVKNGVRQGCVLAPTLFNLFMDFVAREAQASYGATGVEILYRYSSTLIWDTANRSARRRTARPARVSDLLYADDMALVTDNADELKAMVLAVEATTRKYGMMISVDKTKLMTYHYVDPDNPVPPPPAMQISIRGFLLETVSSFRYLGSIVSDDCDLTKEITQRIGAASSAFYSLYHCLWTQRATISLATKIRVYQSVVLSTLLYACETWAPTATLLQRLEVFHMRCLRTILGIRLLDRISNAEILARAKQRSIEWTLRTRRLVWFGHCCRMHDLRLPRQVLFGALTHGSRSLGRPALRWVDVVEKDLIDSGLSRWYSKTRDRETWRTEVYER
jgi:hypothetical protein